MGGTSPTVNFFNKKSGKDCLKWQAILSPHPSQYGVALQTHAPKMSAYINGRMNNRAKREQARGAKRRILER